MAYLRILYYINLKDYPLYCLCHSTWSRSCVCTRSFIRRYPLNTELKAALSVSAATIIIPAVEWDWVGRIAVRWNKIKKIDNLSVGEMAAARSEGSSKKIDSLDMRKALDVWSWRDAHSCRSFNIVDLSSRIKWTSKRGTYTQTPEPCEKARSTSLLKYWNLRRTIDHSYIARLNRVIALKIEFAYTCEKVQKRAAVGAERLKSWFRRGTLAQI
jgi:hypothetical protein